MQEREIGRVISSRRRAMGLTQEGLAKQLDVSPQAISKWETGAGMPDISSLPLLAKALSVSMDQLFGLADLDDTDIEDASAGNTFEIVEEFEKVDGEVTLVHTYHNVKCYSDLAPEKIEGAVVTFADGSRANLLTKEVVNNGRGHIVLSEGEEELEDNNFVRKIMKNIRNTFTYQKAELQNEAINEPEEDSEPGNNSFRHVTSLDLDLMGCADINIRSTDNPEKIGFYVEGDPRHSDLRVSCDNNTLYIKEMSVFGHIDDITIYMLENSDHLKINSTGTGDIHSDVNFSSANITASGSGDFSLANINSLHLASSGASDFVAKEVGELNCTINGSSDVTIKRLNQSFLMNCYGSSNLTIKEGNIESASISIYGFADIQARSLVVGYLYCEMYNYANVVIGRVTGKSHEKLMVPGTLTILERGEL